MGYRPDWKVCIVQPGSRLPVIRNKRAVRRPDLGNVPQARFLAKYKCYCTIWKVYQTRVTHSQNAVNAQQEIKKEKNTKPMKHDTKNARRMCLQALDVLNLRV